MCRHHWARSFFASAESPKTKWLIVREFLKWREILHVDQTGIRSRSPIEMANEFGVSKGFLVTGSAGQNPRLSNNRFVHVVNQGLIYFANP